MTIPAHTAKLPKRLIFSTLDEWERLSETINGEIFKHFRLTSPMKQLVDSVVQCYNQRLMVQDISVVELYQGILTIEVSGVLCNHSAKTLQDWEEVDPMIRRPYQPFVAVSLRLPVIMEG